MTTVIAFGYMNRCGKDTAAAEIIRRRGITSHRTWYDIRRYGFGDALKKEVNAAILEHGSVVGLFAAMDDMLPDWVQIEPDAPMDDPLCPYGKYRTLLQWWGGEYRRGQNPRYWINKLEARIAEDKPEVALISDMRYSNEMAWAKSTMNGFAVRVDRPGGPPGTGHQSEVELAALPDQAWSAILHNDEGYFESFKESAVELFDEFMRSVKDDE